MGAFWSVPLPELAKWRELIHPPVRLKMKADLEEIARMLSGLIDSLEKKVS